MVNDSPDRAGDRAAEIRSAYTRVAELAQLLNVLPVPPGIAQRLSSLGEDQELIVTLLDRLDRGAPDTPAVLDKAAAALERAQHNAAQLDWWLTVTGARLLRTAPESNPNLDTTTRLAPRTTRLWGAYRV
jgi:hypothetical protein